MDLYFFSPMYWQQPGGSQLNFLVLKLVGVGRIIVGEVLDVVRCWVQDLLDLDLGQGRMVWSLGARLGWVAPFWCWLGLSLSDRELVLNLEIWVSPVCWRLKVWLSPEPTLLVVPFPPYRQQWVNETTHQLDLTVKDRSLLVYRLQSYYSPTALCHFQSADPHS